MSLNARSVRFILALITGLALLQARSTLADCSVAGPAASAASSACCPPSAAAISDAGPPAAQLCSNHCLRPSARSEPNPIAFNQSSETPPLPARSAVERDWAETGISRLRPFAALRADGRRIIYHLQRLLI